MTPGVDQAIALRPISAKCSLVVRPGHTRNGFTPTAEVALKLRDASGDAKRHAGGCQVALTSKYLSSPHDIQLESFLLQDVLCR
jgi:hypothetical protein